MRTLIIVDDEKVSRDGIRIIIDRAGLQLNIFEFSNGLEALNWLQQNGADIALVDMKMPIMSGVEFIKEAGKSFIKHIVLSGYSEFEYAAESMKYGALEYLVKPVHRDDLINAIKKTCDIIEKEEEIANRLRKADLINNSRYEAVTDKLNDTDLNESYIKKAKRYIEANYHKNINMAVVANELSLEYSYFSKVFKNETNVGFVDYLRRIRLEKAMEYLISTDYKISEIAVKVGYPNAKNFTTSFRQFSGVTPQEYRNNFYG